MTENESNTASATTASAVRTASPIVGLSPPPPFLPCPGEPSIDWPRWKESFQSYLLATGLDLLPDSRKRAVLVNCLGSEGQRVYKGFLTTSLPLPSLGIILARMPTF